MNSDGLTEVDSTGVLTGNDGIDIGVWTGPPANPDPVKHLPGLEHQAGADWDLYDAAFLAIGAVGIWLGLLA